MKKRNLIAITLYVILICQLVVLSGCKKNEEPVPLPNGPVTIIDSKITLGNLVSADTNIQAVEDSLLVYYYQQDSIFRFVPQDFFSHFSIPQFEDSIKLGLVKIPEFKFGFDISLNKILPLIDPELADSLLQNDSTITIFPPLQLNEELIIDNGPSEDYFAIAIKSGQIEIKVHNTLPVAIENLKLSVSDIAYQTVLKEINLNQLDSGAVYTALVSLVGKKFSNHFAVTLNNFSSPGSDSNEVMLNLSKGLQVELTLKNVISAGGITKANAQLIGTLEKWVDINTAVGERFFNALYKEGKFTLSVTGMNHVNLVVYCTLPSVKQNHSVMSDFVFAPNNQVSEKDTSLNLANFDFTTYSPRPFNRLPVKFDVYLQASDSMLKIDTSDIAKIRLTFSNNQPFYTRGFYGRKTIHSSPSIVEISPNIAGQDLRNILFAEPSLIFNYKNNLNLPVKLLPTLKAVNLLTSESVSLATDSVKVLYPLVPGGSATTEEIYGRTNSNVKDLFDINPSQFIVQIDGRTNWNGQAENFSWDTCAFYGNLSLKIPLVLQSNFLLFTDTVQVNTNIQNIVGTSGKLLLKALNGFPFSMKLKLQLFNAGGTEIAETIDFGMIASAEVDANGKVSKPLETNIELTLENSVIENIQKSKRGVIVMESSTFNNGSVPVSLYSNYRVALSVIFDTGID